MTFEQAEQQCIALIKEIFPDIVDFAFHLTRTSLGPVNANTWHAAISCRADKDAKNFNTFAEDAHNIEFAMTNLLRLLKSAAEQSRA